MFSACIGYMVPIQCERFFTQPLQGPSYPRRISILRLTGQRLVININLTRYTSSS